ncbi:hypothetical protein KI387_004606, partial [Taxus chinensis]
MIPVDTGFNRLGNPKTKGPIESIAFVKVPTEGLLVPKPDPSGSHLLSEGLSVPRVSPADKRNASLAC